MIPSQNINNNDIANQGESNTYNFITNNNSLTQYNHNNRNSPLGSPSLNRNRIPNLIPTQPPTQQKRHNSQSYVLNASTKRGAIFQNLNSNSNGSSPNHTNNLLTSTLTPNIQLNSGNPSTATLANLSTTASSQQQPLVNGKKLNITSLTPTSASQARQKATKTPTPSIPALEVPASPRSRAIAKVYETDMSVEGSSELNDVPHSRGANTVDNRPNSNSPESISDPKQQQSQQQRGIQRRQSTETVVSQPPPQQPQQQQSAQRAITEEEQILASNLQETYKAILRLELETQQGCAEVNQKLAENDLGVEVTPQLWVVYKKVVQLLDHYYDFLLYALSPSSVRAGKPLVNNYRILRRMWVYGIVSFLEVLKNVATIIPNLALKVGGLKN
ncbi:unnamed protein product [Ambrosiozyma monospora]|uniref:Unnamed protein product n=1 Tax=Ambrosiozyma monospora TaxID=43982 RepID=A0ACB5TD97_AMBMO|nr:unnamed protein product [Ambrosiozyma monospora]